MKDNKDKNNDKINNEYGRLLIQHEENMKSIRGHKTVHLCDVLKENFIYAGDRIRAEKDERVQKTKYLYLEKHNISNYGLNLDYVKTVSSNCFERLSSTEVWRNDVIVSLDKLKINITMATRNIPNSCISENMLLLKVKHMSPFYIALYLQTTFGQTQLKRCRRDLYSDNIDIALAKHIVVPILEDGLVQDFEKEYKYILLLYENAMQFKEKGIVEEYEKLLNHCKYSMRYLIDCLEDNIERRW